MKTPREKEKRNGYKSEGQGAREMKNKERNCWHLPTTIHQMHIQLSKRKTLFIIMSGTSQIDNNG